MSPKRLKAQLHRYGRAFDTDLASSSQNSTPARLDYYIQQMLGAQRNHAGMLSDSEFMAIIEPWATSFASYLGASKDLQLLRDGQISDYVSRFNENLITFHHMNEEISYAIMVTWPKAYIGIDEAWAIPAKLCL